MLRLRSEGRFAILAAALSTTGGLVGEASNQTLILPANGLAELCSFQHPDELL